MRLLIDAAASLGAACPDGEVPLITAVRSGHASVVELLLASGATQNLNDCLGRAYFTPLHLASSVGSADIARLLISSRARAPDEDVSGDAALYGGQARAPGGRQ